MVITIVLLCYFLPFITHALCRAFLTPIVINEVVEVKTIERTMKEVRMLKYEIQMHDYSMGGFRSVSPRQQENEKLQAKYHLIEHLVEDLKKENDLIRVYKQDQFTFDHYDYYALEIMILPPIKK